MNNNDKSVLRELAKQIREIASNPVNNERKIQEWKDHISLNGKKPMVFVHPDGSWPEILSMFPRRCDDPFCKQIEIELQKRLIRHQYIRDDVPINAQIDIPKAIYNTMWGIEPQRSYSKAGGAFSMISIIDKPSDWKKLSMPLITHDEAESARRLDMISDAIGDILQVDLVGVKLLNFHLMHWYCDYRGLDNMFYDLYDEPDMVHEVMQFFSEGVRFMWQQYEDQNLLSLNNDGTFHYTGGVSYTDELPAPSFNPNKVRLCDMWGAAEAQEFGQISPEMHEEFVLQYERALLEPFGLNGYGCCDDLSDKLDNVLKIKNLRRVAVCPWADIAKFTPVLQKNYIMTWKPKPMPLAYDKFNEEIVRKELEEGLSKANGGIIELVLRDTHTCRKDPARFGKWVEIARQSIEKVWNG